MFRKMIVSLSLAALLAGATVPATGCYGSFSLTKKLHSWNGQLGHKVVNTLVFWAFVIIPVYGVCMVGDTVIFNLIEFWSGKNPIHEMAQTTRTLPDGSVEVKHEGTTYTLIPATADRFYLLAGGVTVGSGRVSPEGDLTLYVQGRTDEIRFSRQRLEQLHRQLAAAGVLPAM
jgi:hypothetical protein